MKNLIKKILKEAEDDGFDWVDDSVELPRSILRRLRDEYGWSIYIPEVGKEITFYLNPESWNLMSSIRITDIGKRGHGSFGDESHPKYQKNPIEDIRPTNIEGNTYWGTDNFVGAGEGSSDHYKYYNVIDAAKDIVGFSEEAKKLTEEYKRNIEALTSEYVEKIKPLRSKYNFDNRHKYIQAVSVDSKGNIHK